MSPTSTEAAGRPWTCQAAGGPTRKERSEQPPHSQLRPPSSRTSLARRPRTTRGRAGSVGGSGLGGSGLGGSGFGGSRLGRRGLGGRGVAEGIRGRRGLDERGGLAAGD